MTLGSLFDGSGGFPLAGMLAGITPVWASEVEPFAIRVTTKRLPFMKHYGDISKMNGGEVEPVDIITFGSPCQDMSIAGRRSGLDGERSGLFHQAMRVIKEMRLKTNGKYPRYIVWENVPGAFSSNKGEDFRSVLGEICKIKDEAVSVPRPEKWETAGSILGDGFSVAWRVIDAQYWGVPQRRKRIYLVADFAGESAGKVLFESEGVSGYSAEGFRSWQRAAGGAARRAGTSGEICLNDQGGSRMDVSEEVTSTLRAEAHHSPCVLEAAGFCTEHSADSRGIGYEPEKSPTLRAGVVPAAVYENHSQDTRYTGPLEVVPTVSAKYGSGGNNQPFVVRDETPKTLKIRSGRAGGGKGPLVQEDKSATLSCSNDQTVFVPKAFGISSAQSHAMLSDNPHSGIYEADTSRTIDTSGGNPGCNQGGIAIVAFAQNQRCEVRGLGDRTGALSARPGMKQSTYIMEEPQNGKEYDTPAAVVYGIGRDTFKFTPSFTEELQPTLVAKGPGAVQNGYTVRRLTPTECARLQGFPDWWCEELSVENPSENEILFWRCVFETHRTLMGTSSKPKTDRQIIKWLKAPNSDSAEYRLWGNGVALPCVYFILAGIVWASEFDKTAADCLTTAVQS